VFFLLPDIYGIFYPQKFSPLRGDFFQVYRVLKEYFTEKSAAGENFAIIDSKYCDFLLKIDENVGFSPKIPYKSSEYIWNFSSRLQNLTNIYGNSIYIYGKKHTATAGPLSLKAQVVSGGE